MVSGASLDGGTPTGRFCVIMPNGQPGGRKWKMRDQWWKTRMCQFTGDGQPCPRGQRCPFAHTVEELRPLPDLTKTRVCEEWERGQCPYMHDPKACKYAHGVAELRTTDDYFKTAICQHWLRGECRAGASCRHAHGVAELRPRGYHMAERAAAPPPQTHPGDAPAPPDSPPSYPAFPAHYPSSYPPSTSYSQQPAPTMPTLQPMYEAGGYPSYPRSASPADRSSVVRPPPMLSLRPYHSRVLQPPEGDLGSTPGGGTGGTGTPMLLQDTPLGSRTMPRAMGGPPFPILSTSVPVGLAPPPSSPQGYAGGGMGMSMSMSVGGYGELGGYGEPSVSFSSPMSSMGRGKAKGGPGPVAKVRRSSEEIGAISILRPHRRGRGRIGVGNTTDAAVQADTLEVYEPDIPSPLFPPPPPARSPPSGRPFSIREAEPAMPRAPRPAPLVPMPQESPVPRAFADSGEVLSPIPPISILPPKSPGGYGEAAYGGFPPSPPPLSSASSVPSASFLSIAHPSNAAWSTTVTAMGGEASVSMSSPSNSASSLSERHVRRRHLPPAPPPPFPPDVPHPTFSSPVPLYGRHASRAATTPLTHQPQGDEGPPSFLMAGAPHTLAQTHTIAGELAGLPSSSSLPLVARYPPRFSSVSCPAAPGRVFMREAETQADVGQEEGEGVRVERVGRPVQRTISVPVGVSGPSPTESGARSPATGTFQQMQTVPVEELMKAMEESTRAGYKD
ncbi:unnamed protein product [Vitrella brassicaformis CCMP3155]|uniref:C3H1-type domain-containing protein n=2 Tax=Vitrella brassicaformis TaxID=1169539 RepID=A0A0G4FIQ9_VITBC|nr:unnamed protein product [Vitrella brassicaformis CCMP3155]|eukprot:CEM13176.1 unnamed protein product [Vitrella brassicaformis CCMP3155]